MEIPDDVRKMIKEVSDKIHVVGIEFTDTAGNKWQRDAHGALLPRS
jgi:hypothetical protein